MKLHKVGSPLSTIVIVTATVVVTSLMMSFVLADHETLSVHPQCNTNTSCLTLTDIATHSYRYFKKKFDTYTLILLPGKHYLHSHLQVQYIVSIHINSSSMAIVDCLGTGRFTVEDISFVYMTNISFKGCGPNIIHNIDQCTLENCHFDGLNQIFEDGHSSTIQFFKCKVIIQHCSFTNIIGESNHGATVAISSSLMINHSSFVNNTVSSTFSIGGAMYTHKCHVTVYNSTFDRNSAGIYGGGAIYAIKSIFILYNNNYNNNRAGDFGGALYVKTCDIRMHRSNFVSNRAAAGFSGAIHAVNCTLTVHQSNFVSNKAVGDGGAMMLLNCNNFIVYNSMFVSNKAGGHGGAVYADSEGIFTIANTIFSDNTADLLEGDDLITPFGNGGAIRLRILNSIDVKIANCTFSNNSAQFGCCLHIELQNSQYNNLTIINSRIINNTVKQDGVIYIYSSTNFNNSFNLIETVFSNNTAYRLGGTIYMQAVHFTSSGFLTIENNHGSGVVYASQSEVLFSGTTTISHNCGSFLSVNSNMTFQGNTNFTNNGGKDCTFQSEEELQQGGAVTTFQSNVMFQDRANLTGNQADNGGAIVAVESKLYMNGDITISNNSARLSGGGIYAYQSELNFMGTNSIIDNTADNEGGGIHSISSTTRLLKGALHLTRNHASRGGGIFLESNAKLYIIKSVSERIDFQGSDYWLSLGFNNNSADYGGAIYFSDHTSPGTCAGNSSILQSHTASTNECFLQTLAFYPELYFRESIRNVIMNVQNTFFMDNSAVFSGDTLYGGLIDRCKMSSLAELNNLEYSNYCSYVPTELNFIFCSSNIKKQDISSDPIHVCFCRENQPNCSYQHEVVKTKKGERFTLSVVVVDQVGRSILGNISSSLKWPGGTFGEGQLLQITSETCTELKYNILSPHDSEQLLLYAEGPCKDIGISKRSVTVTFLPCTCPIGFQPSNSQTNCECICDPVLKPHITNCSIETESVLREGNFWITHVNDTTLSEESYIIVSNCPYDYCYPPPSKVYINFNHDNGSDAQCAFYRSGVLCGSCQEGLSLSLGSSRCMPCSNHWLALLIPFAIAGIALLAFLLLCNITVAVGTINGLIFYVNIIIANHAPFLPFQKPNVLTVFIAWLNLDFGFETCFYDGMDGYAKVWLQLVFPLYVILLVAMVITVSEYSRRFSRLLSNRNAVAVLATLILLSYAKLLRTIIAALSFTTLEYPDGSHQTVWLYDANIPYLEGKHIPLFIAALLILLVGLTFTLLLFFWQWLLRCPNRRAGLCWIGLNSFMDVYHAPYNTKHRYWTGLLLIARVVLYLISSLDHIVGDVRVDLIAIICVLVGLLMFKTSGRIYKNWLLNVIDNTFILNLLMFSAVTFYVRETNGNQAALAYTSITIAFITFLVILTYHTLQFVFKKTFLTEFYEHIQQGEGLLESICSFRSKDESNTPLHISIPMETNVDNETDKEFIVSCSYTEFDGLPTITATDNDNDEQPLLTTDNKEQETQLD